MTGGHLPASASTGRRAALVNLCWLLGDKVLALVVGLAIFGQLARQLGPAASGHFAYATALLQVGLGLSLVCAGVALLPRFCRIQLGLPGAVANVFAVRLVASVCAMALVMLYVMLAVEDAQRRTVALVVLGAIVLIEPFYVLATYWQSRNNNRPTVLARSSGLIARALIVTVGLAAGAPLWLLAAAWVVEALVNASLQTMQGLRRLPALRRGWRLVTRRRARAYVRFGLRFAPALWMSQLFLRLDRLVLGHWLSAQEFGLYAAPMQLVEVWTQVAYLIASSVATAMLFPQLRQGRAVRAMAMTVATMASVGLAGLLGAWLLGPLALGAVFGAAFVASVPVLVWGAAAAVLLFVDQAVDLLVTARNRPRVLFAKWAVAVAVAVCTFQVGFAALGPLVGPAGIGLGVAAGWVTVWAFRRDLAAGPGRLREGSVR